MQFARQTTVKVDVAPVTGEANNQTVEVQVVTDHVPAAAPAHHPPRLQPSTGGRVALRNAVVEADRAPVPGGGGRLSHFATCPQAEKWRKGKGAR